MHCLQLAGKRTEATIYGLILMRFGTSNKNPQGESKNHKSKGTQLFSKITTSTILKIKGLLENGLF